jgi:respiratory burst oxidase
MRTSSIERCTTSKNELDLPENFETESEKHVYGAMLPVFLNDLRSNHHKELVEITLELEDNAVVLRNIASAPNASPSSSHATGDETTVGLSRSLSIASRIRKKFPWLRSLSLQTSTSSSESVTAAVEDPMMARNARRMRAELERTRSSAQRGLKGLRFISKSGEASEELWRKVEKRFGFLAKDGLLDREEFGECIGTLYYILL